MGRMNNDIKWYIKKKMYPINQISTKVLMEPAWGNNGILGISQERYINFLGSFDIKNGIGVYTRLLSIYPLNTCSYHGTMQEISIGYLAHTFSTTII
jgi:hypothetical protein